MDISHAQSSLLTRRHFLRNCNSGLGALALSQLSGVGNAGPMSPKLSMIAPKAKRVIYLHMAGSPPQQELWDYKPELIKNHLKDCPPALLEGKTFAFIKGTPKLLGSIYKFDQHGPTFPR